jgi:hypothetical protein
MLSLCGSSVLGEAIMIAVDRRLFLVEAFPRSRENSDDDLFYVGGTFLAVSQLSGDQRGMYGAAGRVADVRKRPRVGVQSPPTYLQDAEFLSVDPMPSPTAAMSHPDSFR